MLTPETWKTWIAIWGAVTGTIGVTLGMVAYFRDRARIKLRFSELPEGEVRQIHPDFVRTGKQKYVFVEAVNAGRRVRYVYQPEIWVSGAEHLLLPHLPDF